jgi:pseudouridine-5'-phosphate glycosidase
LPIVGLSEAELELLLAAAESGAGAGPGGVPKANSSNLGILMSQGSHAATTVSTTMELAAAAGVRVFATGGLGGVHQGWATTLDISTDLFALTRFPVAVVASGVKSLLDISATREALETLGVPVVGFGTDSFPAFYLRKSSAGVDARFDDIAKLAAFVSAELERTGRGVLVVNPIPEADELDPAEFERWLLQARKHAEDHGASGRNVTPTILGALHMISGGATLQANIALVRSNARLAGRLRAAMG